MIYIPYSSSKLSEEKRKEHNNKYIEEEIKNNKIYFSEMFEKVDKNIKLDKQQQRIIVTDEDYTLVIAGAGSGKTTTITAKVDYLIKKKKINPEEIIIITFTNKAVEELKERINKDFKNNVEIMTFHKFGYKIIKQTKKDTPTITDNKEKIIKNIIYDKLKENNKKNRKIVKYFINKKNLITLIKIMFKYQLDEKIYTRITLLCSNSITLQKSKNYNIINLKCKKELKKHIKIIEFIEEVYEKYEEILEHQNKIDFEDIINKATEIIKKQDKQNANRKINYKYIIIDEYQDISESRYNLIKNIAEKNNSKIIAVGDDWQCIYSFASANINLFTQFSSKVPYCEILKIENTYRNSQQLIDLAGEFIQKNPKQIKKRLKSKKKLEKPVKIVKYKKNINEKIESIIEYIIQKYGQEKNILILGRYNFDKKEILTLHNFTEQKEKIIYKKYPKVRIDYLTIHSAKGLGYDNVILINTKTGKNGFPSNIKNNKIIDNMVRIDKNMKNSEERRLFYVAITRTKNEIIIMTPKNNPSCFIKEIKKNQNAVIKSNINSIK